MRATSEKYRLNSYDGEELPFENYMKLDNTKDLNEYDDVRIVGKTFPHDEAAGLIKTENTEAMRVYKNWINPHFPFSHQNK